MSDSLEEVFVRNVDISHPVEQISGSLIEDNELDELSGNSDMS